MNITLKEYQVGFGYKNKLIYENTTGDIDIFRSSLLKRLGNVKGGCNKSKDELKEIKLIVISEPTLRRMEQKINRLDRWSIEIKE